MPREASFFVVMVHGKQTDFAFLSTGNSVDVLKYT